MKRYPKDVLVKYYLAQEHHFVDEEPHTIIERVKVVFSKVEFTKGGKLLLIVTNTTLPDALAKATGFNPQDLSVTISCFYY